MVSPVRAFWLGNRSGKGLDDSDDMVMVCSFMGFYVGVFGWEFR